MLSFRCSKHAQIRVMVPGIPVPDNTDQFLVPKYRFWKALSTGIFYTDEKSNNRLNQ